MYLVKCLRATAFAMACATLAAPFAAAQETVNYASLGGRIVDEQGAALPGARVAARQIETNQASEVSADRAGRFRFPYLRVGPYEIRVSRPGFSDLTRTLTLTAGAAFEWPVTLSIAVLDATVVVSAVLPVIESARSQIAGTVVREEIESLPLNVRQFLDLALLVPGVSPPNIGGSQLFAETSAVPGVGLSVASQRNFSNNFVVDGLSANDDAAGLSGIPVAI